MTVPLPSYVKTGTVAGKSLVVSSDTAGDVDIEPDASYPVGSTFTFTPSVPYLVFTTSHVLVFPQPVPAAVNATGDLVTSDGDVVKLVANVGQVENDQDWFWTVQPVISGKRLLTFRLDVTAGITNYLSDAIPIPASSASSSVARGPAGAGAPPGGTPDGWFAASHSGGALYVDLLKSVARNPELIITGTVTRDGNGAATTAPVVWPDGTVGTYTADTMSSVVPGLVDAYHITYGSPATKTYTQPAITRNASGAATNVPAIVVT